MARFPIYERSVGLGGGATASYASEGAFTAPARALANMGDAIGGVGDQFAAIEQKVRETQDNTWFTKARAQTAIDMMDQERQLQMNATDGAKDYTPNVRSTFGEYRKTKVGEAPSKRAAQMYDEWATGYDVDLTRRASTFQAESELAKRTSDFADAMNAHAQMILSDPAQFDPVYKRAMDDLEGAKLWMTPEQETAARQKVDHDLKLARAKSMVEFRPNDFMEEVGRSVRVAGGPTQWREAIASIESAGSGGYSAIGPRDPDLGRALGKYQIMEANIGPWSQKHLGRRVSAGEFLQNPQIQDAIFDAEFGSYVRRYGDAGKAAQAWFGGTGSVGKVGRRDVLGTSVGEYEAKFNRALARLGGGETSVRQGGDFSQDPRYAGLSVDEILGLQTRAETNYAAQQTTAYASMKDAMDLAITTGAVYSEDEIMSAPLDDGDKAILLRRFREMRGDEIASAEIIAGLTNKTLSVDPFDAKAQKAIDNAAAAIKKRATPEQYALAGEEIVRQTGVVPKDVLNELRRGLESRNAQDVAAAAQQAARLSQIDGAALGRRDGGKSVQDAADEFAHLVNDLNLSPEDAARRMIEARDPEKQRARSALEPAAKEFLKSVDTDVGQIFDTWFGAEPNVGFSPGQELGIVADFKAMAEDQFYAVNGDPELARARAVEEFKRIYGVTSLTGRSVVMKYPPEKYWPAFPIADAAQSLSYPNQLKADIAELDPTADMGSVQLVTTPETAAMIKRGELPGYAVIYKDANGVLQTIPGKLWKPDFTRLQELQGNADAAEQKAREDAARAAQPAEREKALQTLEGRDREKTMDKWLSMP